MHAHTHACVQTYVHGHMHACTHTYIHMYIHTYVHTYIHTYRHMYIRTLAYVHRYIHTHIRTYIHTYIHRHTFCPGFALLGFVLCTLGASQPATLLHMYVWSQPAKQASQPGLTGPSASLPRCSYDFSCSRFPFLQLLRFWYHSLPNKLCQRLHTYIFTYTLQDEPKSSGVHGTTGVLRGMSVHNPPSGVPMCTHTYIHTYIDKGYIYMGGGARGDHF